MRDLVNQLDILNLLLVVHTYKVCKPRNQKTLKLLSMRNKNDIVGYVDLFFPKWWAQLQ